MTIPPVPASRSDRRIALLRPASVDDERVGHAMQLFDSILWASHGATRSTWISVPPDVAEVIVVHQDDADERIAKWRAGGKLVVEIATERSADPSTSPALVYPFRPLQALALLERLDAELNSGPGGHVPPAQAAAASHPPAATVDPWSFVETLRTVRAVQNSAAWLVARDAKVPLLWLRADGAVYFAEPLTLQAIRLGTLPLGRLNLQKGASPPGDPPPRSGTELSWFAGYHASAQLAPWLQVAARYRVTRWPNFGAIRPPPSQLRVAAALAAAPAGVSEIAQRARVSLEEATRTLNALAACDLVVAVDSNQAPPARTRRSVSEPRGGFTAFLRNVRKHLGLGS